MPVKKSLPNTITGFIETIGLSPDVDCDDVTWWANMATVTFVACCSMQTVGLLTAQDSERLFECFSVLSFCSMGLLKLFSLRMSRTRWLNVISLMKQLENNYNENQKLAEEYDSDDDTLNVDTFVEEYTSQSEATSALLARVYNSTAVGFILSPFIEYTYMRLTGQCPVSPHILPCWSPLDQVHIAGYVATILLECVAAVYCVTVHLVFDSLSASVMIFTVGQFLLLRRYCENIAGKGRKCDIVRRRDARAMCRIRHSHQSSIILINIVKEFGKLIQNIMGIYYLNVTLTLCTVAVRLKRMIMMTSGLSGLHPCGMLQEVLSTTQLLSLLQYLGATLTQLFLFCYYGNAVCEASWVCLGQGPSGCAYWCISPRVRRHLALLSIGMTFPRRLRAGPFNFLDLPAFTAILRGAYSYYAVLAK